MPLTIEDTFHRIAETYLDTLSQLNLSDCYVQKNKLILQHHVYPFIGEMAISRISRADIRPIENRLRECAFRPAYRSIILGLVKRVFFYAEQYCLIRENPCANIDLSYDHSPHLRIFTPEENQLLLEAFKKIPLGDLYTFLFVSGLKLCECLALKKSNYDSQTGKLYIESRFPMTAFDGPDAKPMKHPRTIVLPEAARQYLESAARRHPTSIYFFRSPAGGNITTSMINHNTKKVRKISGVQDFKVSYMKYNFILHCMEAGINDVAIEQYLGIVCKTTFFQIRHIPFAHCFHPTHQLN